MLRQVFPHQLSSDEIELYDRAIATYPQSGGVECVSPLVYSGEYGMYICDGRSSKTLVIVRLMSHPNGTTDLFIIMLSGNRSFEDFDLILDELKVLADENGCQAVTGVVNLDVFDKFNSIHDLELDGRVLVNFPLVRVVVPDALGHDPVAGGSHEVPGIPDIREP